MQASKAGPSGAKRPGSALTQTASCYSSTDVSLAALSVLDQLSAALEGLEADDGTARAAAAQELAQLVEKAYGDEAETIGAYVRESGGVALLLETLGDPSTAAGAWDRPSAPRGHRTAIGRLGAKRSSEAHPWPEELAFNVQAPPCTSACSWWCGAAPRVPLEPHLPFPALWLLRPAVVRPRGGIARPASHHS